MQINVAKPRQIKHPFWNDAAISNDENCIRLDRLKLSAELFVGLDLFRLDHGDSMGERGALHRRRLHLHAAPCGPIRLRHDQRHLVAGSEDRLQSRHGELRRSAKD